MKLLTTLALILAIGLTSKGQHTQQSKKDHPDVHKFVVKDVLQTSSYTYLQAEENGEFQWLAMPKIEANIGETYYRQNGMEMVDFKSKELDRTFDSILFLNGVIDPEIVEGGETLTNPSPQKSETEVEKLDVSVEPAVGGITIADLFSNKEKYANEVVKIRGTVVKFSSKIMGKNWIHLQDGSGNSDEYDLTVTTMDEAELGDIITAEGTITLDKDFGAGYLYDVIMENGKVTK